MDVYGVIYFCRCAVTGAGDVNRRRDDCPGEPGQAVCVPGMREMEVFMKNTLLTTAAIGLGLAIAPQVSHAAQAPSGRQASSYTDLLAPIENAVAQVQQDDAARAQDAAYYYYPPRYHHHHHHYRHYSRWWYHHHYHHDYYHYY
jgi:hypothetical protein